MESKSKWELYKEKNGVTVFDIVKKNIEYSDEKISEERYQTCLSCDHLIKLTHQCKKCGCFMKTKTKFKDARCPIQKW